MRTDSRKELKEYRTPAVSEYGEVVALTGGP